jgi:hypothetical protein
MGGKPLRDLVVLLPGITGSVLQRDGKDIWAISGQAAWQCLTSMGDSLQSLFLGSNDPGAIVAARVMPDAHVVPGLIKIGGYSAIAKMVATHFDIVPGSISNARAANFIEFPYDWRLDNRINAQRLHDLIADRLPRWREHSGNPKAKVIFLAHSMGGLIARYFLEVLEGWRDCRALITFGTPYRGSLSTLNFLVNGYKRLFIDLTEVMRSFPSAYQLLPIYRALRIGEDYVRVADAGRIPGIEPTLAQDALAFHREIETKVEEHRKDSNYLDHGYVIVPVVGTCQTTMQSAVLTGGGVTVSPELPSWIDPLLSDGDGTVPRASAIPIELSDAYQDSFVPERHGSLQCNPSVLDDVRGRLEQMQVRGLREIRTPDESNTTPTKRPAIALDLDDLYLAAEPVILHARLVNLHGSPTIVRAKIELVNAPTAVSGPAFEFTETNDGDWTLEVEGLTSGLYRVEVRTAQAGPSAPPPVHDLFEVAGPA